MARNINTITLTGNLTADPETFSEGTVCRFRIAVNGAEKVGEEWQDRADFFDVTCFGGTAKNAAKYLSKGRPVAISGRLRQDRWEDDAGNKRSAVKVIAREVQFLSSPKDSDGGAAPAAASSEAPPAAAHSDVPGVPPEPAVPAAVAGQDDIPF